MFLEVSPGKPAGLNEPESSSPYKGPSAEVHHGIFIGKFCATEMNEDKPNILKRLRSFAVMNFVLAL